MQQMTEGGENSRGPKRVMFYQVTTSLMFGQEIGAHLQQRNARFRQTQFEQ
jgi:hypothetical protein